MAISLSKKVLILVTVPVLFEIVLASTLFVLMGKAEKARAQAAHARELSSHINGILALCLQRVTTTMLAKSFLTNPQPSKLSQLDQKMTSEIQSVTNMVANAPEERKAWQRINDVFLHLDDRFTEAWYLYYKGDKNTAALSWVKMNRDMERIIFYCNQLASQQTAVQVQRQKEMEQYNKHLRGVLELSIATSILVAFGLAFCFNRGTTDRLNVLMQNSKLLAMGHAPATSLTGGDELAKLDALYRQMYQDLMVLRQKERAVLDNAAEIICSIDEHLRIVDINDAVAAVWGYTREDIVGRRLLDLVAPDDREAVNKQIEQAMSGQNQLQARFEALVRRFDGTWSDVSWSITWSQRQRSFYCVLSDISERKQLERMKQEFVAMISHDLRTPLSSVLVSLDTTIKSDSSNLSQTGQESLVRAKKNLTLSLSMINQLLDLEKMEAGLANLVFDAVSTRAIYTRAAETVADLADRKQLQITIPASNVEIVADGDRLVQVMINLLGNAIKFAPAGTTILISEDVSGERIRIAVTDHGPGIPQGEQAIVFERFHQLPQADSSEASSGLGLAICKTIVGAHQGTIGVTSKEGDGSIFWFDIPVEAPV